ncbi:hypothetical protein BRD19_04735 [Halobacteriales archaeon SW_7_65_23]|nr:MAG: hypothetical protein BRD19_04735 [Halobacteriales archaeon SW_7_65_23]
MPRNTRSWFFVVILLRGYMTTNNKCHPRILPAGTIYMMVSFEQGVRRTMSRTNGVTTVEHEKGLHARPASVFVQTASEFEAEIEVVNGE